MLYLHVLSVLTVSCAFSVAVRIQSVSEAKEELLSRERRATGTPIKPRTGVFGNGTTLIFTTPCVRMETSNPIQIQVYGPHDVRSKWEVDDEIFAENSTITLTESGCPSEDNNGTAFFVVDVSGIQSNASTKQATFRFDFAHDSFYWWITNITLKATFDGVNGTQTNNWDLRPQDTFGDRGYAYLCQDQYAFTSDYGEQMAGLQFPQIILKPFLNATNNASVFGDATFFQPCEYAFTIPLWMATVTGLIMALILALGISMLVGIKTPDRFDDPKTSKLLSVPSE
ncbi:uncharacterized protein LOC129599544 [Paramacrobiotus metropolitanus]|uniref:uncharacterized protein LOC129588190 n=1 Tax=Paramacrobiotus metropolitanus TaxID=2943436 RepID=UPI002445FF2F|nr:uncharacterized protein LOC129588190 [Paramacrobiotus metropolitanus]XP_055353798.1 uncharacterized protein LOC129599544 [Paramacrobiotus metropolitanus]